MTKLKIVLFIFCLFKLISSKDVRTLQKRSPQFGPGFANFLGTPKPNRPTPRPLTLEELQPGFPIYNTELLQPFVTQPPIVVPLAVNNVSDNLQVGSLGQIQQVNSTSLANQIYQGKDNQTTRISQEIIQVAAESNVIDVKESDSNPKNITQSNQDDVTESNLNDVTESNLNDVIESQSNLNDVIVTDNDSQEQPFTTQSQIRIEAFGGLTTDMPVLKISNLDPVIDFNSQIRLSPVSTVTEQNIQFQIPVVGINPTFDSTSTFNAPVASMSYPYQDYGFYMPGYFYNSYDFYRSPYSYQNSYSPYSLPNNQWSFTRGLPIFGYNPYFSGPGSNNYFPYSRFARAVEEIVLEKNEFKQEPDQGTDVEAESKSGKIQILNEEVLTCENEPAELIATDRRKDQIA